MLTGGAYASKYDEDNSFEPGTHAAMNDVLVELTWDGIKWNVPAGIYVHVVCKNPEAPTTEELTNLFDGKVTIDCVNFAVEHEDMICGLLPDGYMLGSMEKIGDQWHVNLTLKIGVYANYFDDQRGYAPGTHHMYDSNDVIVTLVWNDETDSWELFSDAVTVRVNCKTPEAPGEDQIPGILEGKPVLIKCINENRKHDLVDQTYGLMDGSYKVMGVNEVDGTWTCTVEINVEQYLKAFIEKTGSIIHVESGAATQQVILTWDTERNTWLAPVDDVYAATFEATCDPDMTSGTYELTGFSKELVTDPSEFPMDSITYPVDGVVTIPYDGTVTLLYKLTVTGDPGAQYTIKDEEAQFAGGDYSLTGTIPSEGFIEVFVTKTFSADDINADGKLVNTALVEPGDRTEGPDDGSDTEEVEAKKEVETYTIVYHGNGGYVTSNPDKDQTTSTANVGEETTLKNADTFTRDGYVFQGWALTAEGEVAYQGSQKVTFDAQAGDKVNLYAVWAEDVYTIHVSFNDNDNEYLGGGDVISTYPDQELGSIPTPTAPEGMTFAGWKVWLGNEPMYEGEFTFTALEALYEELDGPITWVNGEEAWLTFEAVYSEKADEETFTVTFDSNGGSSVNAQTVESGKTVAKPADPTRDGYDFEGWFTDEDLTIKYDFNTPVTADITLYAAWDKQSSGCGGGGSSETETYAVYYHSNYGSDERKTGGRYEENDEVEVRDNDWWDRDNYRFLGWNTEEDGSGRDYDPEDTFDMPDEDVHLYAQWRRTASDPSDSGTDRWLETQDHRLYMVGYPDDTFGPDRNMTRAEVAQMFYALLLDQNVSYTENFSDVPSDAWYAEAVNTLAALGMIDGYPDCTFRPDATITRAEFCVIALAFAYEPESFDCSFYDVSVNDWFYDYVAQATSYGWISGGSGAFRPNDAITRAEVSVIVNNMLGRVADEDYVDRHEDELTTFPDVTSSYWAYYSIMETTNSHDYTKSNGTENWR